MRTQELGMFRVRKGNVAVEGPSLLIAHIWNTLPTGVVAASSLSTFRRLLKRFLFEQSYADNIC